MYRLISYDKSPPGEYWYQQNDGVSKTFGRTTAIETLANKLSRFRSGNNLPRADYLSCLEDIDTFTCNRLNNNSSYCYDTDRPFGELHPGLASGGCTTCGADITPP